MTAKKFFKTIEQLNAVKPEWNWRKCPGCQDKMPEPVMNPSLWLIEDSEVNCKWLVVNGWLCGECVFGTVVLRGPDATKNEKEPKLMISHDHVYITGLTGRTVRPY